MAVTSLLLYWLIWRHTAALRESERRFRALIENSADAIARLTADGAILYESPSVTRILGYQPEERVDRNSIEFLHPDDHADSARIFGQVIQQRRIPVTGQVRYRHKDGSWRWVEVTGTNLLDEPGVQASVVNYRDITGRKQMEAALHDKVAALETLHKIDREIMAATERQSILDLVCRRATELAHTPKSAIAIQTSPFEFEMTASFGLRDPERAGLEFARQWQTGVMRPSAWITREAMAVKDLPADIPHMPEFQAREGIQSLVITPLAAGPELVGVLMVYDSVPREWSADELQLLSLLAGQAAIAIEKTRLYEMARSRAAQLETLNTIGQAITSTLDLTQVLTTLLENVVETADVQACSVALVEADTGDLVFRQAVGQAGQTRANWNSSLRRSISCNSA